MLRDVPGVERSKQNRQKGSQIAETKLLSWKTFEGYKSDYKAYSTPF